MIGQLTGALTLGAIQLMRTRDPHDAAEAFEAGAYVGEWLEDGAREATRWAAGKVLLIAAIPVMPLLGNLGGLGISMGGDSLNDLIY